MSVWNSNASDMHAITSVTRINGKRACGSYGPEQLNVAVGRRGGGRERSVVEGWWMCGWRIWLGASSRRRPVERWEEVRGGGGGGRGVSDGKEKKKKSIEWVGSIGDEWVRGG